MSYGGIEYHSIVPKKDADVNRKGEKKIFYFTQISVKFFGSFAYSTCSEFSGGEAMNGVHEDIDDMIFAGEVSLPSDR